MTRTEPGPRLESLLRRLADCPADFLAEPAIGTQRGVAVPAVVSDLLLALGGPALAAGQAAAFTAPDARAGRNRLRLALVAAWLLYDPWFRGRAALAGPALVFLQADVTELAAFAAAESWVTDPERREELVRRCLRSLGLRPAGETAAQSEDRLATLDSAARERVVRAARRAEQRARAVREALAREASRQASLKAMRE